MASINHFLGTDFHTIDEWADGCILAALNSKDETVLKEKNKVRKTPLYWLARKLFLTQKVGNSQRDIRHDFEYSISVIGELLHLKSFHKVKSFQLRPKLFSSLNESWEKI